jgi:uncharacterized protein
MELSNRIYHFFEDRAKDVLVECVNLGLGYTAVTNGRDF